MESIMNNILTDELTSIALLIGGAWLLGFTNKKHSRSWIRFLYNRYNRIDNIYQLLPILQKNAKALFLIFNDIATAVNSLKNSLDNNNDSHVPRDVIKAIISQDYYRNKINDTQNAVLNEFGTDVHELNLALQKFSHDDQVQIYLMGVEMMYNSVLDGGYPQCPGVDVCSDLSRECVIEVLERVMTLRLKNGDIYNDEMERNFIMDQMMKYGCMTSFDALVLFRNAENLYNYDFNFIKEKSKMIEKFKSIKSYEFIQRVTENELEIIKDSIEDNNKIYLLVFDDLIIFDYFISLSNINKRNDKSVMLWLFKSDIIDGKYPCLLYPCVIKFSKDKIEAIYTSADDIK